MNLPGRRVNGGSKNVCCVIDKPAIFPIFCADEYLTIFIVTVPPCGPSSIFLRNSVRLISSDLEFRQFDILPALKEVG